MQDQQDYYPILSQLGVNDKVDRPNMLRHQHHTNHTTFIGGDHSRVKHVRQLIIGVSLHAASWVSSRR